MVRLVSLLKSTTPNPSLTRRGALNPPPILGGARGGKVYRLKVFLKYRHLPCSKPIFREHRLCLISVQICDEFGSILVLCTSNRQSQRIDHSGIQLLRDSEDDLCLFPLKGVGP